MYSSWIIQFTQVFTDVQYTTACDVYSLAIVTWEVLSRQPPYGDIEEHAVSYQAAKCGRRPSPMPPDLSNQLIVLIEKSWAQDPNSRLTSEDFYLTVKMAIPEVTNIQSHKGQQSQNIQSWRHSNVVVCTQKHGECKACVTTLGRWEATFQL